MMFAPPAGLAQLTFAALTVPRIADWFSIVLTGMGLYLVTVLTFIRTITEFDKGN